MHADDSRKKTTPFGLVAIGTEVAQYGISDVIGTGGMSEVYLAEDRRLSRRTALKFLAPHLCDDQGCRGRFLREAQTAARLAHPNIITIYDVGEYRERPFMAMEYVRGESLQARLLRQEMTIAGTIELIAQVADALASAHSQGVIHRDIKPSNILIDHQGRVRLVDFGLAAMRDVEVRAEKGLIFGTLGYMSPEQLSGRTIDERSDLFSLGIVLYEMIARQAPFGGDSGMSEVRATLESEPLPLSKFRKDVPLAVADIVKRLLMKDPDARYQRADLLYTELRRTLVGLGDSSGSAARAHGARKPSVAVLPFTNLSPEVEQNYFCEGIAEETLNALTKVRGLNVAGRGAAFAMKGQTDVLDIGRKLQVDALLEGSVQKAGERLRISVQLTDVNSGYQLWSDRYDRQVEDLFRIQDEIAASVVKALRVILTEDERRAITRLYTDNLEAYDLYLRGRQLFHQNRRKTLKYARELFEQATQIDPGYALAYVGVADCCSYLVHWYGDTDQQNMEIADRASLQALNLAPESPDTHAARGLALWVLGNAEESEAEFKSALAIEPKHFEAQYYYARACFQAGRFPEAARLFEQACEIQEHHEARFLAAQTYEALDRHDQATLAYRQAIQAVRRYLDLNPGDARAITFGAVCLCRLGEQKTGIEWAERALAIDVEDAGVKYNVACLFALYGNVERALDCLEQAIDSGFANHAWLENDPDLEALRSHPRFDLIISQFRSTTDSTE